MPDARLAAAEAHGSQGWEGEWLAAGLPSSWRQLDSSAESLVGAELLRRAFPSAWMVRVHRSMHSANDGARWS